MFHLRTWLMTATTGLVLSALGCATNRSALVESSLLREAAFREQEALSMRRQVSRTDREYIDQMVARIERAQASIDTMSQVKQSFVEAFRGSPYQSSVPSISDADRVYKLNWLRVRLADVRQLLDKERRRFSPGVLTLRRLERELLTEQQRLLRDP